MLESKKPWRKILYECQDYPDNYTAPSFLDELKKNINLREVSYQDAFLGSCLVTQELCIVVFFTFSFIHMYDGYSAEVVFCITTSLTLCGYVIYAVLKAPSPRHFCNMIGYILIGWLLSPVLQTLTATISTDTIYATTVVLLTLHLIFFDYGVKVVIVSRSLSINASTFGSLCLASRLPTPFHAFVLLTTAVESFVLFPLLLNEIENKFFRITILTIMVFLCSYGLYCISVLMAVMFLSAVVFINLICPYLFVSWLSYKENIYGPWDEAIIATRK